MRAFHQGMAMQASDLQIRSRDSSSMRPFLEEMLRRAQKLEVSDIHFSCHEDHASIAFRIYGTITPYDKIPVTMARHLSVCIKVVSGLEVGGHKVPQEGRFEFESTSFRVSVLPCVKGEKIVLRMQSKKIITLHKLVGSSCFAAKIESALAMKSGLILVIGPTGSGKTTTLHAMLTFLVEKKRQVVTIEDPVENQVRGVHQVEVSDVQGRGFADVLPYVLRQDPDVIMVGEVRDSKTANLCAHAVMTGHLVLASIHAATCVESMVRYKALLKHQAYHPENWQGLIINQRLIAILGAEELVGPQRGVSANGKDGYDGLQALMVIRPLHADEQDDQRLFYRQAMRLRALKVTDSDAIQDALGRVSF